jgi:hypothetical protein
LDDEEEQNCDHGSTAEQWIHEKAGTNGSNDAKDHHWLSTEAI